MPDQLIDVLAIVGSEHWPAGAELRVKALIREELEKTRPDMVISGGAPGVDTWAVEVAEQMNIPYDYQSYLPEKRQWAPRGFKARNIKIGRACTRMLCIRSGLATRYGSGWTADFTSKLDKPVDRRLL